MRRHHVRSAHSAEDLCVSAKLAISVAELVELAIMCDRPTKAKTTAMLLGYANEADLDCRIVKCTNPECPSNSRKIGAYACYKLACIKRDFPEYFWTRISEVKTSFESLYSRGLISLVFMESNKISYEGGEIIYLG